MERGLSRSQLSDGQTEWDLGARLEHAKNKDKNAAETKDPENVIFFTIFILTSFL